MLTSQQLGDFSQIDLTKTDSFLRRTRPSPTEAWPCGGAAAGGPAGWEEEENKVEAVLIATVLIVRLESKKSSLPVNEDAFAAVGAADAAACGLGAGATASRGFSAGFSMWRKTLLTTEQTCACGTRTR